MSPPASSGESATPLQPAVSVGTSWSVDDLSTPRERREPPQRDVWHYPWVVYLSWLLLLVPLGGLTLERFQWDQVPPVWGTSAMLAAAYAILWPRQRHRVGLLIAAFLTLEVGLFAAAAQLTELTLPQVIGLTFGSTVHALGCAGLCALALGTGRSVSRWAPLVPADLLRLGGVLALATFAAVFLGVLPGTHPFAVDAHNFAWAVRATSFAFIGTITVPLLWWHPDPWPTLRRDIAWLLAVFPMTALLQWVIYTNQDLPLTWMLMFPAIWAGWVLSPRAAALWVVSTALTDMVFSMGYLPVHQVGGWFPPTVLAELLISSTSFVGMLIALFRRQQARLESSLREERSQAAGRAWLLAGMFDSMSEGVLVFEHDGHILLFNETAQSLFGSVPMGAIDEWSARVGLQDIEGAPLTRNHPGVAESFAGQRGVVEVLLAREYGKKWLSIAFAPLRPERDSRVLAVVRDVTADRVKAEELRSFAGVVAHDLRTPLTSLRGWLEVLEEELADDPETAGDATVQRSLAAATQGSRRLAEVVDDWLSFTVGRDAELDPVDVVLSELVAEAAEDIGHEAVLTIDAPDRVRVDQAFIRQVFASVCGNAVKYRRPGIRPTVQVTSRPAADPGFVRVEVRDNGTGIDPAEQQRIFEEFDRYDVQSQRRTGTGLGLALSRRIVERHGGAISAQANPEAPGTTIVFTLPAAPPAAVAPVQR